MITINITKELLDNIIEAYNKKYKESITEKNIESLSLGLNIIVNNKVVSWSSVYFYD